MNELDRIYDLADALMQSGQFRHLDAILRAIRLRVGCHPTDKLLAWLTATLPAKSKLPSRELLVQSVRVVLDFRGEDCKTLVAGLE